MIDETFKYDVADIVDIADDEVYDMCVPISQEMLDALGDGKALRVRTDDCDVYLKLFGEDQFQWIAEENEKERQRQEEMFRNAKKSQLERTRELYAPKTDDEKNGVPPAYSCGRCARRIGCYCPANNCEIVAMNGCCDKYEENA
jgi:hypothetical protein